MVESFSKRSPRRRVSVGIIAAAAALSVDASRAHGIVVYTNDSTPYNPTLYTTAPADDPGWDRTLFGGQGGTGFYLGQDSYGRQWALIAAHFDASFFYQYSGQGAPYSNYTAIIEQDYSRPQGFFYDPANPLNGTDLRLVPVKGGPNLPLYPIRATTPPVSTPSGRNGPLAPLVRVIGTGATRTSGVIPDLQTLAPGFQAGFDSNSGKTWANQPITQTNIYFGPTRVFETSFPATTGSGLGLAGDSGSPVFLKNGSTWELAGTLITSTGTNANGIATTGNSFNTSVDLSYYRSQLLALINRPATFAPLNQIDLGKDSSVVKAASTSYGFNSNVATITDNSPSSSYRIGSNNFLRVLFLPPRIVNYTGFAYEDDVQDSTQQFTIEVGNSPRVNYTDVSQPTLNPMIRSVTSMTGGMALWRQTVKNPAVQYSGVAEVDFFANTDNLFTGYLVESPAIIASAPSIEGFAVENIFNRKIGSYFDYATPAGVLPYVVLDFGATPPPLTTVEWLARENSAATGYRLTFSNDLNFTDPSDPTWGVTATTNEVYSLNVSSTGLSMRYLRFEVTSGPNFTGLDELAFYANLMPVIPEPALPSTLLLLSPLLLRRR